MRVMRAVTGLATSITAILVSLPPTAAAYWSHEAPMPAHCADITWDAQSGVAVVRPLEGQSVEVRPRAGSDWGFWKPLVPGNVGAGAPMLLMKAYPAREGCGQTTNSNYPFGTDMVVVPLEQVRTLRLHLGSDRAGRVELLDWMRWRSMVPGDFRLEVVGEADGPPASVGFHLGGGYRSHAVTDVGVTVGVPSSTSLDLDGDGDVELAWSGVAVELVLGLTQHGDRADLRVVDAAATTVRAGDGDDHVHAPVASAATLELGGGDDQGFAGSHAAKLDGADGTDLLLGSPGDDVIAGGLGDDRLLGGEGADTIAGGAGVDRIEGGSGDDYVRAGDGDDLARGGPGSDALYGELGDDRMWGDSGHDTIIGAGGSDRSWGGPGNDRVGNMVGSSEAGDVDHSDGGAGHDIVAASGRGGYRLLGGSGNDYVQASGGAPLLIGGAGHDYLFARHVTAGRFVSGPGNDAVVVKGVSIHSPEIGRRLRALCGAGRDWVAWPVVHVVGCEWHQQRDGWDRNLGRPIRDDTGIPRAPSPPEEAGPPRRTN